MIFCHIQHHTDTYKLFYDRFGSLFKIWVFKDCFRWRQKDRGNCWFLFFTAVTLMPGLTTLGSDPIKLKNKKSKPVKFIMIGNSLNEKQICMFHL